MFNNNMNAHTQYIKICHVPPIKDDISQNLFLHKMVLLNSRLLRYMYKKIFIIQICFLYNTNEQREIMYESVTII